MDRRAFVTCKHCRAMVSRSVTLSGVCPDCVGQLALSFDVTDDEAVRV